MTNVFVFDTNCLISAHLLSKSVSRIAYSLALNKGVLIRSEETFAEFSETLIRPKFNKYLSLDTRLTIINEFELRSFLIEVTTSLNICRDPKDDKFINLALSGNAKFIITGDNDLLDLGSIQSIPIIKPVDFIRFIETSYSV